MLTISFVNVGYGEAILLQAAGDNSGTVILIDGGSGEDEEYAGNTGRIRIKDYLAKRGIDTLDLAIVTHPHEDHVCGLEQFAAMGGRIKKLFTVRKLPHTRRKLDADPAADSGTRNFIIALNSYGRLLDMMEGQGVPVVEIDGGTGRLQLAPDLEAEIMAPSFERAEELSRAYDGLYKDAQGPALTAAAKQLGSELNGYSLVLMLHYRGEKIFLPGDATPARLLPDACFQKALAAGRLQAKLVKLGHHGQADSVTEAFINATCPSVVVTFASSERRYDSADPLVYAQIEELMVRKGIKPVFLFSDYINPNPRDHTTGPRESVEITLDGKTAGYSLTPP